MGSTNKESYSNIKVLLIFISISSILGLWMVFASKAQSESMNNQTQPQPIVSGEIYFPEMPTLVPMVDVNQQMAEVSPETQTQDLRSVSIPTPVVQQSAPQVGIQSIIVGGSSSGSSSSSDNGSSTSSQPAPQTTTKSS